MGACGAFLDLHSPWCLWSQVPLSCTLPVLPIWACCPLNLRRSAGRLARWRGDWSCCCRRIPQSTPEGFFLFEKKREDPPAQSCHSIQGRACSLTQPTSPARSGTVCVSVPHSPTLNSLQLASTVSVCLPCFVLLPLPATSSNQVSLGAAQALFVRGVSR